MSGRPLQSIAIDIATGDIAEVRIDILKKHRALYATQSFGENEVMVKFSARTVHPEPNFLTIQLGEDEHIELLPAYLECTNHSCDPNCFFDTSAMHLIALRNIAAGEELTFFYPSTEWEMDRSFPCTCGSHKCIGVIEGAKFLPDNILGRYRFTEFILQKLMRSLK
jgi:hypothetical protein